MAVAGAFARAYRKGVLLLKREGTAKKPRRFVFWALWAALSLAAGLGLAKRFQVGEDREVFLPGKTSHGHYQIELKCEVCHTEPFGSSEGLQEACESCHSAELDEAQDSHPRTKFTNPRNAERVANLDARLCVTCHSEHQPERTGTMGLSLPEDYCYECHQDIAEERASHEGLAFDSCASAGCHNFHDNRALYEDFLVKHAGEAPLLASPLRPLSAEKSCPAESRKNLTSDTPLDECRECHDRETQSWLEGRHGMRIAQGLSPMQPGMARLPMKKDAAHLDLSCASCHANTGGEAQSLSVVEVDSCLGCHNDQHSLAYKASPHFELLQLEESGRIARGGGVSCATCHMPRVEDDSGEMWVNHNQNANLRPNEKMIRSVCGACHGLPFSIDALADPSLIQNNFSGFPTGHVQSVDFATARQ